ncbi:MAG TPA: acetyl-CoA synthetase [Clostridiaceae bacterium]|nr:acetyl-CoA synthetase [Clostridiaceae bacterium]
MARFLNEYSSKNVLRDYGLPTGEFYLAKSKEEAVAFSQKVGYPVVLKIVSDQIIHKTEAKGIKLNLKADEEVIEGYNEILSNAREYDEKAVIDGVLVSKMLPGGIEVIVGGLRDAQFGPVVMFGLGGVFVEVFKDVQFRMAPLKKNEAADLIRSIKAYPMLTGFRGMKPVNMEALAEVLVQTGNLMHENNKIKEIDLNPVICYEGKVKVLDASIGLEE